VAVRWLDFAAPVQVVRTKVVFSAPNHHHQIALVEAPKMHYLFAKNGQGMGKFCPSIKTYTLRATLNPGAGLWGGAPQV
jgi:hypothetical protein